MKLTTEQALRFLELAIGADDSQRGKMYAYFTDVLGLGVAPSCKSAELLIGFLKKADSRERLDTKDKSLPGLRKFVAHLRALADALDPERLPTHPSVPEDEKKKPLVQVDRGEDEGEDDE